MWSTSAPTFEETTFKELYTAKHRRLTCALDSYMDLRFILGSVAEVEWLWSLKEQAFANNRQETTSIVLEALIFLHINSEYWNIPTVKEAMPSLSTAKKK